MAQIDQYMYGKPYYNWVFPGVYERTREEYPYAYSAHYIKGDAETAKGCSAEYTDRLQQHDRDKYNKCKAAVFYDNPHSDNFWRRATLDQCSQWASLYYNKLVKVCAVAEECHQGNGYPLWIIWIKDK